MNQADNECDKLWCSKCALSAGEPLRIERLLSILCHPLDPPSTIHGSFGHQINLTSARLSVSNSVSGENGHPWADVMQWHVPWQHDVWGQVQARERPSCWYLCWLLLCWINSTPRSPASRLETPLTVFLGNVNKLCDRWNHFFAILADFGHVWDPSDFLHI